MKTRLSAALILLGVWAVATAQTPQVTVQFSLSQKAAVAGSKVKGIVKVSFPAGLHGYQNPPSKDYMIPLVVKANAKDPKLASVAYPKGVARKSAGEKEDALVYEGTIEIPVEVLMPSKPGTVIVKLLVSWQTCSGSDCFPPEEVTVTQKISVKRK